MEWEYNDQGFKKVFETKDLRNQKQILILLLPLAYIDKTCRLPTAYKSLDKDIRHVMLIDPRLKSLYYP